MRAIWNSQDKTEQSEMIYDLVRLGVDAPGHVEPYVVKDLPQNQAGRLGRDWPSQ